MNGTETDCRTEEGITVGLIDAIISISRVLATRNLLSTNATQQALLDLIDDEDLKKILDAGKTARIQSD